MGKNNSLGKTGEVEPEQCFDPFGQLLCTGDVLYPLLARHLLAKTRFRGFTGAAHGAKPSFTNSEIKSDFTYALAGRNHALGVGGVAGCTAVQAPHHGIDERRLATAHWTSDGEEIQSGEVYLVGMPIGRAEGHEIFEAEVLRSHCGSSVAVLTS